MTSTPVGGWKFATATRQGTRRFNADAASVHYHGNITAAAVIDGIDNNPDVVLTAWIAAEVAVRFGARKGALVGLLTAGAMMGDDSGNLEVRPEAVGVLAVMEPGWPTTVVLAGDCRAWSWTGGTLVQHTVDNTVGQLLRDVGAPEELAAKKDHLVLTTVARSTAGTLVRCVIPQDVELIMLTSDGVHDQVSRETLEELLGYDLGLQELAQDIVDAATGKKPGERDDATVVLLRRVTGAPAVD